MKTVYLAGPINGLSYTQATQWRLEASTNLTLKGYNVLDPMRGKHILQTEEIINDSNCLFNPTHILTRDLYDLDLSNIVIANMEYLGSKTLIGTLMELGYVLANMLNNNYECYLFNVPLVYLKHPFFSKFTIVNTLEDVLSLLEEE